MSITLTRVAHDQAGAVVKSILLDKIDKSQGNSDSPPYAQLSKQQIYVPYANPVALPSGNAIAGYSDLVQTDNVLLAMELTGSIGGLETAGEVTVTVFSSALVATPAVTGAANAGMVTTVTGTTFLSVAPDVTELILENPAGTSTQVLQEADFASHTATTITFADATITIGSPTTGWKVTVYVNSKQSNQFTLT